MNRKPDPPEKRFYIQRRRLGVIKFIRPEGDFGFIDAEDFREDVFFHKSSWQGEFRGVMRKPLAGDYVEFQLDEECFAREKKLRAVVVTPTDRPMGKRLTIRDTPNLAAFHHPKARRKRPSWRGAPKAGQSEQSEGTSGSEPGPAAE